MATETKTQNAGKLRFSHDAQGRIVFNGQPYLYLSAGSLPEGQQRAAQQAAWLNECLAAAQLAIIEFVGLWDSAVEYEKRCEKNAESDSEKAYRQGRGEIYELLANELKAVLAAARQGGKDA